MSLFDDPRWRAPVGGAGGKKQKKPPPPHIPFEYPDSISTNQFGVVVDAISEGPIEEIVGGLEGLYLDETPVVVNGVSNFKYLEFDYRKGTEDQTPLAIGSGVENEVPVSVRLKYGVPIVREITSPGVDAVRVQIGFGGLAYQDVSTGDTHGSTNITYTAAARANDSFPSGTAWAVNGKSRTRFTYSYLIPRPGGEGPWRIKVWRGIPDSDSSALVNESYFDSYTEIISAKVSYPFTAVAAIGIRADEFSQLPSRGYHIKGLKIKVPTNYEPNDAEGLGTGAYSGEWDGQFKIVYSNNPAWIWYDIATNERYGLGQYVRPEHIDKWALYRIGRYCDDLVETGFTNELGNPLHERRFVMNLALQSRELAYKVLSDMSSVFRGMAYWSSGLITFSQDSPKAPLHQFTPANVKDGLFNYTSSARTARHTVVLVRWNNPANYYMPETEYVEDEVAILRYGVRPLDVTAFGTTSRGQAHRLGRWLLATERMEKETVTFQTGLEAATLRPGDIVNIVDPMRGGKRFGGRLKAGTVFRVELDEPVTLDPGVEYEVSVLQGGNIQVIQAADNVNALVLDAPFAAADLSRVYVRADMNGDGEYELNVEIQNYDDVSRTLFIKELGGAGATISYRVSYLLGMVTRTVTSDPGTTDSLSVSPNFDIQPESGQVWMLAEPNLTPRPYRIAAIQEAEKGLYEVLGLQYEEAKFAEVDTGLILEDPAPETLPPSDLFINPPSGLSVVAEIRVGATGPHAYLSLDWTAPSNRVRAYRVSWRVNYGNWQMLPETAATELSLPDARPGLYDFEIIAISVLGQMSRAASISYNYEESTPIAMARVTGLELDGQGHQTGFKGHDARFSWRFNDPNIAWTMGDPPTAPPAWFAGFVIRIVDPPTNTVVRTELPQADPRYVYTLEKNKDDGGPRRSFRIEVAVRDIYGRTGDYAQLTVTNPAPALLSNVRLTGGFREVWVETGPTTDQDYLGKKVWAGASENFPLDDTTLVCDSAGNPQTFPALPGTRYWVRVAAYDQFGSEPELLNVSGAQYVDTQVVGVNDLDHLGVGSLSVTKLTALNLIVDTAHIKDLAVETIKIANHAVTLFDTVRVEYDRCIIGPEGEGEVGQDSWCGVLTSRIATIGGLVEVGSVLQAQVTWSVPNAFAVGYSAMDWGFIGGIGYGQALPQVKYRVVRIAVQVPAETQAPFRPAVSPGTSEEIYVSGRINISGPGYAVVGTLTQMDQPQSGLWDYQLQLKWLPDIYDVGQITMGPTIARAVNVLSEYQYLGWATLYNITSTGGTRWKANARLGDRLEVWVGGNWIDVGSAVADPPGIGWRSAGREENQASSSFEHNFMSIVYPGGTASHGTQYFSGPYNAPYYPGTLTYRLKKYQTTSLTLDAQAGSFLTTRNWRK